MIVLEEMCLREDLLLLYKVTRKSLTKQQRLVLRLWNNGHTHQTIAVRLGLQVKTIYKIKREAYKRIYYAAESAWYEMSGGKAWNPELERIAGIRRLRFR